MAMITMTPIREVAQSNKNVITHIAHPINHMDQINLLITLINVGFRARNQGQAGRLQTLSFVRRWPTGGGAGRSLGTS
jgi:hydrogenase/urease accessory protein HupE